MASMYNSHSVAKRPGTPPPELSCSSTLCERLEALPQELYDRIYDLTFTADAAIRIYIMKGSYGDKSFWLEMGTEL
ncbi:hypothetical protein Slin14017_G068370 [Septoria linicola]|nr:hypothetical protein Slin14017_G068370 [Septoria linicola]